MKVNKQITVKVFDGTEFDNIDEAIKYCKSNSRTYAFEFYKANVIDEEQIEFRGYILINEYNRFCEPIWGAEYWAYEHYGNRIFHFWGTRTLEDWRIKPVELTKVNPDEIIYWRKSSSYEEEDEIGEYRKGE